MKPPPPDFRSPDFLRRHLRETFAFYDRRCVDDSGGFYHAWNDDGSIADPHSRDLASSTGFVVSHACVLRLFPDDERAPSWRAAVMHGLDFVQRVHQDADDDTVAWRLRWEAGQARDRVVRSPVLARCLVLLAQAQALLAGVRELRPQLEEGALALDRLGWDAAQGLYLDRTMGNDAREDDADAQPVPGLQSLNLIACEAMLACHEATADLRYLERAATLAYTITETLARSTQGLVGEADEGVRPATASTSATSLTAQPSRVPSSVDYTTAHQFAWVRWLLALERRRPNHPANEQLVHRARALFAATVQHAWDRAHDGLARRFALEEPAANDLRHARVVDGTQDHVTHAHAIAAAALLAERTLEGGYWDWYDRLWEHAWEHLVDRTHGGWYDSSSPQHERLTGLKSPPGKTDQEVIVACADVLSSLQRAPG